MAVTKQLLAFVILLLVVNSAASASDENVNIMEHHKHNSEMFKEFELRMSKFEKSEENMKASISALLGTNALFRLQIEELTKRVEGYENREAEHLVELRNLKEELKSYKSTYDRDIAEFNVKATHDENDEHEQKTVKMPKKTTYIKQKRGDVRQVITSSPIAFTSYLDHHIKTLGKNQAIVFNQILLNEGHGYNNSSGVFHVPVSGIYLFSWAVTARKLADEPAYDVWTHLVVNGGLQVGAVAESRENTDDNQGSSSVVIRVQAGDDVWVSHTNSYLYVHGDDQERTSSFMGVLLYEEEGSTIVGR